MKGRAAGEWRQGTDTEPKEGSHAETGQGDLTDELLELVRDHSGNRDSQDSDYAANDESNDLMDAIGMNILNNLATNGAAPFGENILDLSVEDISEDIDTSCVDDREILLKLDSKGANKPLQVTPIKALLNGKGTGLGKKEHIQFQGQQKPSKVDSRISSLPQTRYLEPAR